LLTFIENKKLKVVLDVWEKEPDIDIELLKKVLIGTPHIAGYSLEGKINGTQMVYNSLCNFLGADKTFSFKNEKPLDSIKRFDENMNLEISLDKLIESICSIKEDDERMRKMLMIDRDERKKYFDLQRKNYPNRREFDNYSINSAKLSKETKDILEKLRFRLFI
jgi:erythronate-4-phosphate dehydrogenase